MTIHGAIHGGAEDGPGMEVQQAVTPELATVLLELVRTAVGGADVVDVLMRISDHAVALLPSEACGILVRDGGGALQAIASSSSAAAFLDLLQVQDDEGPSLECLATGRPVEVVAGEGDDRWPRFSALLAAEGLTTVHASPMRSGGRAIGALNLLGRTRLAPEERTVAQAFADLATLVLLHSDLVADAAVVSRRLHLAVQARATLGQAIGVIAERFGLEPDGALKRIQRVAAVRDISLIAIATAVVARDGSHPEELDVGLAAEGP
jgi:hypothetical protein